MDGKYRYFEVILDGSQLRMSNSTEVTRYVAAMDNVHALIENRMPMVKKNHTKIKRVEEISFDDYCDGLIIQALHSYLDKAEGNLESLYAKYFNN